MKCAWSRLSLAATLVAGLAPQAFAAPTFRGWPRLEGGAALPACQQALALGRAAYTSPDLNLLGRLTLPAAFPSDLTFVTSGEPSADGDGLMVDPAAFSTLREANEKAAARIYWQKVPNPGPRIVIGRTPFTWQGDAFYTFLIDAQTPAKALWEVLDSTEPDGGPIKSVTGGFRWSPPIVLHDKTTRSDWVLIRGEPYELLGAWRVLAPQTGATALCTVRFAPPFRSAPSLLPSEVRRFAALLDDALGPGLDEGTLHPTAAIRLAISIKWANAALRPWALVDDAYNSRAAIDAGLRTWAQGVPARTSVRSAIAAQWPKAEAALQRFYSETYGVRPQIARHMSRFALDTIYRGTFTFSRANTSDPDPLPRTANPWPTDVR